MHTKICQKRSVVTLKHLKSKPTLGPFLVSELKIIFPLEVQISEDLNLIFINICFFADVRESLTATKRARQKFDFEI